MDTTRACSGWSSYQLDGTCEQQDPLGRPRQADNQIEARLLSFMCPTVKLRILTVERDEWPCWSSSPTQADDVEFTYESFYFILFRITCGLLGGWLGSMCWVIRSWTLIAFSASSSWLVWACAFTSLFFFLPPWPYWCIGAQPLLNVQLPILFKTEILLLPVVDSIIFFRYVPHKCVWTITSALLTPLLSKFFPHCLSNMFLNSNLFVLHLRSVFASNDFLIRLFPYVGHPSITHQ